MQSQLAELASFCRKDVEIAQPLSNLKPHIVAFAREAGSILRGRWVPKNATLVPYIARGLLESIYTAMLFRIDPFRALTLTRFQSHADFDHNRPNNISIDWSKDFMSEEGDRDIWAPKQKADTLSRALLSPYHDAVIWQPALLAARDFFAQYNSAVPTPDRIGMEPVNFVASVRGQSRQLYSFWSKGIHCEFFAMEPIVLDEVTCIEKLRRTVDMVVDLCFVSQFALTAVGNITPSRCVRLYQSVKEKINAE